MTTAPATSQVDARDIYNPILPAAPIVRVKCLHVRPELGAVIVTRCFESWGHTGDHTARVALGLGGEWLRWANEVGA